MNDHYYEILLYLLGLEIERYIDVSSYRNTRESDTGIDTIFNISIYRATESEKTRFLSMCLKKIWDIYSTLCIAMYRCIVIFFGQCIDTFKSYIIPSLTRINTSIGVYL